MTSATRKADNPIERGDIAVAEALTPVSEQPAVQLAGRAGELGDQPPLYMLSGGVIAAGLATGDARTLRAGARMLAAHAIATMIKNLLKRSVDRTRPSLIAENDQYESGKGTRFDTEFNSFPSGHTASSVAVARALGREYPGQHHMALALASGIAGLQVVRGKHYLSDVAAGMAIGIAAEAAVDALFRRFHPDLD
ncbi:MAG TPA: phosphatase PAP2 family protein [Sphingomicrobium sp.]|nr:phosphatase PAP2 family protein [Sphingomicrobium sp.]